MIEVEQLSKIYGSTTAIENVTFTVPKGEILGFLGPNGAGKTTTMRILSGYLPATRGIAKIEGLEVHEHSMAVRQKIGYLPETPPLYRDMSVEGFLKFVAEIKGAPRQNRQSRVDYALERCNLLEKRKVLIQKLSKGFRQRVGIAQAIVHDPSVIILDEPTVGLDPKQIIDVRNLIRSLRGDHTVILSTHILSEVSVTCDKVTIINKGKIVATGNPETLTRELADHSTYEIQTTGTIEQIKSALSGITPIQSIQLLESAEPLSDRTFVQVVSGGNEDIGCAITSALVNHDLGLYEIRRQQASLENVFLQLTAQEKQEMMTIQEATQEEQQ